MSTMFAGDAQYPSTCIRQRVGRRIDCGEENLIFMGSPRFRPSCLAMMAFFVLVAEGFAQLPAQSPAEVRAEASSVPLETVDAATRSRWLLDGRVFDATTGEAIKRFTVTPASISIEENGKSLVRWRDNLRREMRDGKLQWPRTSGFSVMRFKITADGYRPTVTPTFPRGGPYVRVRVKLVPAPKAANP